MSFPEGKRYNSFTGHYKRLYGERLQKLVLDAGFSCPNRDGTLGTGGCTYCDNQAFHPSYSTAGKSLWQQIDEGIEFHKVRYSRARYYIAYFQSFSNTYAPLEKLQKLYCEALSHPAIAGIAIGTRPDCIDSEKLDWIADLKNGKVLDQWKCEICDKPVVALEYGVESCYDQTLRHINRGHDFACARDAIKMTAERGIDCCGHFILGLPGESREMLLKQCETINSLPLLSVKFHQLQFVRGTRMETEFEEFPERFLTMELDEYIDFMVDILERLREDLYIERIAGEVPPRFVKKAQWGLIRNVQILQRLDKRLEERGSWQGRLVR